MRRVRVLRADGRNVLPPCTVIPAYAGILPTMTSPPCADAPLIPYDGPRRAQSTRAESGRGGQGGASFSLIPASNSPNSASKQPQTCLIGSRSLRVNEAK